MSRKRKGGDCYEVAGNSIINGGKAVDGLYLVHATVVGPETPRHGHAWIEHDHPAWGWLVIDRSNGNDVTLPRDFYYEIGHVDNVVRYDRETALTKMLSTGHYGPWEQEGA